MWTLFHLEIAALLFFVVVCWTSTALIFPRAHRLDSPSIRLNVVLKMTATATSAGAPSSSPSSFRVLNGIQDLADDYDVYLLDMWGCLHDGLQPYDGVLETLQKLKHDRTGKDLVILSNSSKRRDSSVKMLAKLGFDPADFSQIVTSGEVAHQLLLGLASVGGLGGDSSASSWIPSNVPQALRDLANRPTRRVYCFGSGDGDEEYLNSAGWTLADSIDHADLIVARGTFTLLDASSMVDKTRDGEDVYFQAYTEILGKATQRRIPMIVCNPDKVRPDADKSPMPGTIGTTYNDLLTKSDSSANTPESASSLVYSIGKPFPSVYEIALRGCQDKSRACMVGDALESDVTGANLAGIDSIWVVEDGIHNQAVVEASHGIGSDDKSLSSPLERGSAAVLQEFNQRSDATYAQGRQVQPTIVLPHFKW
jgi:HAD superfamily hydrolase (TIGR01450 family)